MYGYAGEKIAVDYPTITRDLIGFFQDAKKECNRRFSRGDSIDYSELWEAQIAQVQANIQLSQDPATLKYNVEFTADRMNKHGQKCSPDTYKKFTAYISALNKHLEKLLATGAVNAEEQAALEALYQGSEKAKDMVGGQWWKSKKLLIFGGGILSVAIIAALMGEEK